MVRKSQDGRDWFEKVVVAKERVLIRYTRKITGDLQIAKEIVQEALLSLWNQKLADVRDKVVPWLFTVCRNKAIDFKRRNKKMSELKEETITFESYPEDQLYKLEIFKKISELDPKYQEVILLKFQEGMSYKEISNIIGKSQSNVGLLIHEGMKNLRSALTKGGQL